MKSSPPGAQQPQQPLALLLSSLQNLVWRLGPLVSPPLHSATFVITWQDRTASLAVCAVWCVVCALPRLFVVHAPFAIVLAYMGYHYSEKMRSLPAAKKKDKPNLPPLPKLVRFISRILTNVHAFIDKLDVLITRLSWRGAKEQDSIQLFQHVLISYGVWIVLNAMLPLNLIIMFAGLIFIAWNSEAGEIVREIVRMELEKARGIAPTDHSVPSSAAVASGGGPEARVLVPRSSTTEPAASDAGGSAESASQSSQPSGADTLGESNRTSEANHEAVTFGTYSATVSLNPPAMPSPSADLTQQQQVETAAATALRRAEADAKRATDVAMRAQIEADRAEDVARVAIAASEVAMAVASEDAARNELEAEDIRNHESDLILLQPVPPPRTVTVRLREKQQQMQSLSAANSENIPAEVANKASSDDGSTAEKEDIVHINLNDATPSPIIEPKDTAITPAQVESNAVVTSSASLSPSSSSTPTSPTTAANKAALDPAAMASNRLQQRLAEVAQRRLREAAAAKAAAAAAVRLAADRIAAVRAATTPEPLRYVDSDDLRHPKLSRRQRPSSMISIGSNAAASLHSKPGQPLAETLQMLSAASISAATGLELTAVPARTSSRVHSQLSSSTNSDGLRNRRATTNAAIRDSIESSSSSGASDASVIERIDAALELAERFEVGDIAADPSAPRESNEGNSTPSSVITAYRNELINNRPGSANSKGSSADLLQPGNVGAFRHYGSLRLSDDEDEDSRRSGIFGHLRGRLVTPSRSDDSGVKYDAVDDDDIGTVMTDEDTGTVILHDDAESFVSGYTEASSLRAVSYGTRTPTLGDLDSYRQDNSALGAGALASMKYDFNGDDDIDGEGDEESSGMSNIASALRRRRSYHSDITDSRGRDNDDSFSRRPVPPHLLNIQTSADPFATKAERNASTTSSNVTFATASTSSPTTASILSKTSSRWTNRKALDVVLSFETFENQRWWVGLGWVAHLLPAERPPWSDFNGTRATPRDSFELLPFRKEQLMSWKTRVPLEEGKRYIWDWDSVWFVDLAGGGAVGEIDEEGWAYADNFWKDWKNRKTLKRVVRHRRWVRHARLFELGSKGYVKFRGGTDE